VLPLQPGASVVGDAGLATARERLPAAGGVSKLCNSPAIFAPNGDARRAKVYRCTLEAGHRGGHGGDGFLWGVNYPVPEPERVAAAEAGRLRDYDARPPLDAERGSR
jgi:hypothetical protein